MKRCESPAVKAGLADKFPKSWATSYSSTIESTLGR